MRFRTFPLLVATLAVLVSLLATPGTTAVATAPTTTMTTSSVAPTTSRFAHSEKIRMRIGVYWTKYVYCNGAATPSNYCMSQFYYNVSSGNCGNYEGCFYYNGRYWKRKYYPDGSLTQAQWNCLAGIAVAGLSFFWPPVSIGLANAAITAWGCHLTNWRGQPVNARGRVL